MVALLANSRTRNYDEGSPYLSHTLDPWPTSVNEQEDRLETPVSLNVSHAIEIDSWFIDRFSSLSRIIEETLKIIRFIGKLSKKYNEKLEFNINYNEAKAKETKNAILLLCKINQRQIYLN